MELCWRMLGTAMTASCRKTGLEKRDAGPSLGSNLRRLNTVSTASAMLTVWHRKVAQATPSTPMPKAVTNSVSTSMLAVEDAARNKKGVRESPSAENMPVATL